MKILDIQYQITHDLRVPIQFVLLMPVGDEKQKFSGLCSAQRWDLAVFCKWRGKTLQNGGFLLEKLSIQYCYVIKVYNLLQVRSEKTLKLSESPFNVVFAVRNLPKIEYIPKQTLSKLDTDYSLENGGFCKWRGFGQTKNPPFSRFYCISEFRKRQKFAWLLQPCFLNF